MAATIANAIVAKVAADLSGFQAGMNKAEGVAKNAGQKVAKAFKAAVAGIAVAGAAAVALGKQIFDVGSSVLETRSKFETVFGAASAELDKFALSFGQLAGLSKSQAQGVLATTGSIVQGMGFAREASADFAKQVVQLSGDLASFNDVPTAEVAGAIQSALTGERESLKRLGIVILETDVQQQALLNTGKENAKALTQQEKATATLQLITERAGVAVGDLARTQDSAANRGKQLSAQIANIKETLAVAFLPVITQHVLPALQSLVQAVQDNQDNIIRWGTAFIEVGKVAVTTARDLLQIVGGAFGNIGAIIVGVFTFDLNLIKTAIVDMKDVVVTNVQQIVESWKGLAGLPAAMDAAVAAAASQTTQATQEAAEVIEKIIFDIIEIPRQVGEVALEVGAQLEENLVPPIEAGTDEAARMAETVRGVEGAVNKLASHIKNDVVRAIAAAIVKALILKAIMSATTIPGVGGIPVIGGLIKKIPIIGGFFQAGGIVPGWGPTPILAHGGEGVLTPHAVQRIGGPAAVERLNRGDSSMQIETINLSFPSITDTASLKRDLPGILADLRRKGRI